MVIVIFAAIRMLRPIECGENVRASDALHSLDAVLTSPQFRGCPQLVSFLRFVVMTTLDGHGDRLKGYTIAVEALGRGERFDPQSDAIVRVEAVRLRRALARYDAGEGAHDAILIELRRGSYVPSFRRRGGGGRELVPALLQAMRALRWLLRIRLTLRAPRD
jgi:hypothetical protein